MAGAAEEVALLSAGMKDDESAVAPVDDEGMAGLEAKPKSMSIAVSSAAEMIPHVVRGLEEFFGTELLKWQRIDQDLSAPAEQQTVDGSAIPEAFQS